MLFENCNRWNRWVDFCNFNVGLKSIAFGNGKYVSFAGYDYGYGGSSAAMAKGHGYISTSVDGLSWSTNVVSADPINSVVAGNGVFVAVGGRGSIYTSP